MSYQDDLIEKIKDNDKWPTLDRPEFLEELDVLASEACDQNTIYGYLAALLIYHQICEEIVKLLVKESEFYIQLCVFPAEISFQEKKKLMFGQLLEELQRTVSFEGKDDLIAKCQELNKIRVDIVHRLTRNTTLEEISRKAAQVEKLYADIFSLFIKSQEHFDQCFHNFKKEITSRSDYF
jgi:hypothetical protein